jgi:drug/metabolite transporter (DMT)-like permease
MGELAALSASAFWAFASLLFTELSREYGPIVMNALKCIVALGMMAVTLLVLEGVLWPVGISTNDTWLLAVSGLVGLSIGDTAYFHALTRLGARRALLMTALVPPVTAFMAWPALGEGFTPGMLAGMALTMGGVVWVIMERMPTPEGADRKAEARTKAIGVALALVAVVCQSTGNVLTKMGGADASAIGISVVRVTVGSLGLLVVVGARGKMSHLIAPFRAPKPAARLLLATLTGTYLGIWLLNAGLKYTAYTGIAATLSSTSPIFILPLAWLMTNEELSTRSIIGAVIAVVGVAVLFLV